MREVDISSDEHTLGNQGDFGFHWSLANKTPIDSKFEHHQSVNWSLVKHDMVVLGVNCLSTCWLKDVELWWVNQVATSNGWVLIPFNIKLQSLKKFSVSQVDK